MQSIHEAVFRSQPDEHASRIEPSSGALPVDLTGTLLRSGPGLMQLGDAFLNFFDGHALIAGVSFSAGRARFRSRFVRSPLYAAETAQRTVLARRVFTNRPQRWANLFALKFGNSAMHDVYAWGDGDRRRVVAGNDFGHFALNPCTLDTLGSETWSGAAPGGMEMSPMPYPDPHTGRLIGWLKKPGGLKPDALSFVELDGSFRVVERTPSFPLAGAPALVHDQRATASWYVATEQALRLKLGAAIWGAHTVYEALATPPGGTATVLLVSRADPRALIRVALPAPIEIAFHVVNAFDHGPLVCVDLVTYGGRVGFGAAAPRGMRERTGQTPSEGPLPRLMRFVIDPAHARVIESRTLSEIPGEAPEVADSVMGRPYRYAYAPAPAPGIDLPDRGSYVYYGALAKHDVELGTHQLWSAGRDAVVSPCAFVPRLAAAGEDDGWLLAYVLREPTTELVVLDARALASGPVATLDLGVHLPGVSHVRWASDVMLD